MAGPRRRPAQHRAPARSAARKRRWKRRSPTWTSARPSANGSTSSRRCNSASPIWRPRSKPRAPCCGGPPRRSTARTPMRRSFPPWPSASSPTRLRRRQSGAAIARRLRLSVRLRHREDRARSARAPDSRRHQRDHAPHRGETACRAMSERHSARGRRYRSRTGALRRLTLNRPQALNAITLDMAVTMTAFMREWADDPAVGTVLIDGAGDRAFCAGGDIRALYDAVKSGDSLPAQFWADRIQAQCADRALSEAGDRDHGRTGDGRRRRPFGACGALHCNRSFRSRDAGGRHRIFSRRWSIVLADARSLGAGHLPSADRQSPQRSRCDPLRA